MTFSKAVRSALSNYVTVSGRARRSEFWWFCLFTLLVGLASEAIDAALNTTVNNEIGIVRAITTLALLLPLLAVTARRLHDTGRTGWWMLLPLAPFPVGQIAEVTVPRTTTIVLQSAILLSLAAIITVLVFLCLDSNPGPNKYSPRSGETPSMTFSKAVRSALSNYVAFSGRARRSEFWWFYLFTLLVGLASEAIDAAANTRVNNEVGSGIVRAITTLALLLPLLAVTARRLHDTGRTGWWMLLPLATFPVVLITAVTVPLVATPRTTTIVLIVASGLLMVASIITVLVFLCLNSNPGPNKYGPSPKQPMPPTGPRDYYPPAGFELQPPAPGYGPPYGYPPQP